MCSVDWSMIAATLLGPILAVQAQKTIERFREQRDRQLRIFHVLMSTRALGANSIEHVNALNSIDLFFNKKRRRERPIVEAWNAYFDHLNFGVGPNPSLDEIKRWNERGSDLLVNLLERLSALLRYDFDRVQLKRGIYFPKGQGDEMQLQTAIRENVLSVLTGKQAINMNVTALPKDDV